MPRQIPLVSDVLAGSQIARGLFKLIYRPSSPVQARTLIRNRLARRDQIFLEMVFKCIWAHPTSPYRRLLNWAGWTYDTVRESVERRGVDDTLKALADARVCLSYEEFKGRKPIERGSLRIECTEDDFNNPVVIPAYEDRTSGTRSRGSRVPASLEFLAENRAPARVLLLDALGVTHLPIILWLQYSPGLHWWLSLAHMGRPPLRWFGLSGITGLTLSKSVRMTMGLARVMVAARGLSLPRLEHLAVSEQDAALDSILAARRAHGGCVVVTTPSVATRLAGLAGRRDVTLEHVIFVTQSEPLTPGKYADITRRGARVAGRYGFMEAGSVAEACTRPEAVDDSHVMRDSFGLVCERRTLPDGRGVDALIVTTLLPSGPRVLLNVESDDFADVSVRRCGCPWDDLGLHTHLSNIRSFSKLTGEGTTLLGTDCVRILEVTLPREFGGTSVDYQLLEAEDSEHLTRLYLVIHPSVGPVDETRVVRRFLEELHNPAHARGTVPPLWQQAETIRVLRQEPVSTPGGKLLPFHTQALVPGQSTPFG